VSTFGSEPYRPSRWIAVLVVVTAIAGVALGLLVFNGLT
jgi:hypothetical protein